VPILICDRPEKVEGTYVLASERCRSNGGEIFVSSCEFWMKAEKISYVGPNVWKMLSSQPLM